MRRKSPSVCFTTRLQHDHHDQSFVCLVKDGYDQQDSLLLVHRDQDFVMPEEAEVGGTWRQYFIVLAIAR